MGKVIRAGLDTSKHVFQVHGVDESERVVLSRQLSRGQVEKFFARLAPTVVGLEACGSRVVPRCGPPGMTLRGVPGNRGAICGAI